MYVVHPLIRPGSIQEREYQATLADSCYFYSTLVVLPTGLGKTVIALRVMAEVLHRDGGKVLLLAPTKPLVEQHAAFLDDHLVGRSVVQLSGEVPPEQRAAEWNGHGVIVSTPQVVINDLRKGRIDLQGVKLIIFDEAHRATGRYAYVPIAQAFDAIGGRVLGITASPGGSKARIKAVCDNLHVRRIEARTEEDASIMEYLHEVRIETMDVDLPEGIADVCEALRSMYGAYISKLNHMGFLKTEGLPRVGYVIEMNKSLRARSFGKKNGYLFNALSLQAMAIKVGHALELAETQGVTALTSYMEKLKTEAQGRKGSKASQRIVASPEFARLEEIVSRTPEGHPKIPLVRELVTSQLEQKADSRVMVFTNYRDSCEMVARCLSDIGGARVSKLVGQSSRAHDKGQNQKEQVEVLSHLRSGRINTVVATCVGEEGLDVANTDLVIFYEPVPSEIRSIQRRGRTGRSRPGRVVVLVTKGTSDEPSLVASDRKEKAMRRNIQRINREWSEGRPTEAEETA
ncbi:MAG: helicase-related protein [Methanomassiliicoccus sp.]|nr:helicase-related protein [Methanomassiliicoccus sp.]